jgi:hypothetical protein
VQYRAWKTHSAGGILLQQFLGAHALAPFGIANDRCRHARAMRTDTSGVVPPPVPLLVRDLYPDTGSFGCFLLRNRSLLEQPQQEFGRGTDAGAGLISLGRVERQVVCPKAVRQMRFAVTLSWSTIYKGAVGCSTLSRTYLDTGWLQISADGIGRSSAQVSRRETRGEDVPCQRVRNKW